MPSSRATPKKYRDGCDCSTDVDGCHTDSLVLRITKKCNNNCIFCAAAHQTEKNRRTMQLEEIKRIIDSREDKNIFVEISGSEPTLHPHFFQILEYCNNKFKAISITTNARLFYYNKLVDRLKDMFSTVIGLHFLKFINNLLFSMYFL